MNTQVDNKPLSGVRVVSVEQFGAAPYGSMFLADLGAEVIKVENLSAGGDPARQTGPYFLNEKDSEYFQTWNSNKHSVTLDLKTDAGWEALQRIIAEADAVMNNLRGDKAALLGLDYKRLAQLKPSIVCLHLSAYGRDNERAAWPGYDYLMQAEAGLMHLTGDPDRPPTRMGPPSIIDHVTGLTAMVGLLSGVIQARATGIGCDVDTCLFDVALHQLGYTATWYLNEGHVPERKHRSAHFSVTPVQTFPTADSWVFVMCMTDKFWHALVEAMGRNDLAADPRFATPAARTTHQQALAELLDREFRQHGSAYWLDLLGGRLPIAPVLDLPAALDNPFVARTGMVSRVGHPDREDFRMLGNPIKINGKRLQQTVCPPMGASNPSYLNKESPPLGG